MSATGAMGYLCLRRWMVTCKLAHARARHALLARFLRLQGLPRNVFEESKPDHVLKDPAAKPSVCASAAEQKGGHEQPLRRTRGIDKAFWLMSSRT